MVVCLPCYCHAGCFSNSRRVSSSGRQSGPVPLQVIRRSPGWLPGLQVGGRVGAQAVEAGGGLADGEAGGGERYPANGPPSRRSTVSEGGGTALERGAYQKI